MGTPRRRCSRGWFGRRGCSDAARSHLATAIVVLKATPTSGKPIGLPSASSRSRSVMSRFRVPASRPGARPRARAIRRRRRHWWASWDPAARCQNGSGATSRRDSTPILATCGYIPAMPHIVRLSLCMPTPSLWALMSGSVRGVSLRGRRRARGCSRTRSLTCCSSGTAEPGRRAGAAPAGPWGVSRRRADARATAADG